MLPRNAIPVIAAVFLVLLVGSLPGGRGWTGLARAQVTKKAKAQQKTTPTPAKAASKAEASKAAPKGPSDVEKAILAIDDEFVKQYNKGDSKALATMFAEDAEAVEADGDRYQGRSLIEQRFAETFAASPGVRIAIETDAIRALSPEVIKEEGRTLVTPPKGTPVETVYTVLYVKKDGRWLISSVREEVVALVRPHDRLMDLQWMVGEWVEERPTATVRLICRWSEDENFLMRTVTVNSQGKPVMKITQRIGWDPLARQIRSWDFDSEGGYGEGRWSQDGKQWVVKHTGVQPDGLTTSATNIMSNERPDQIRWISTDRVIGDETLPDAEANILVRVPPPPGEKAKDPAPPKPAANTERSPR